eukprot:g5195.t1
MVMRKEVLAELASSERPIGYYCLREADSTFGTVGSLCPLGAHRTKIFLEVKRSWSWAQASDSWASLRQNVVLNKITNAEVKHIDWHDFLHISSAATFRRLIAADPNEGRAAKWQDVVYYSADLPALAATIGAHLCEGGRADILTVRRDWRGPLASERATAEEQFITHLRGDDLAAALTVYGHVTVTELLGYCCTFEEVPLALITLTRDSRVESRDKRQRGRRGSCSGRSNFHLAASRLNCHPLNGRNATEQESIQLRFTEEIKPGVGFFELWDIEDTTGPKLRVDVEMLAAANPEHFGRKLIDGNTVSLIPDLLCAGNRMPWNAIVP